MKSIAIALVALGLAACSGATEEPGAVSVALCSGFSASSINVLSAMEDGGGTSADYFGRPPNNPWYFRFGLPVAFREAGVGKCVWTTDTACRSETTPGAYDVMSGTAQCDDDFSGGAFSVDVTWTNGDFVAEKTSASGVSLYRGKANAFLRETLTQ